MASIRKTSSGWQVQLRRKGYPSSTKSFTFKADAQQWAREAEAEMQRGFFKDTSVLERTTLEDLLKRYLHDIAPNKKGSESEAYRLKRLVNDQLSSCSLKALDGPRVAEYRDRRLREVSSSSVRRELVILSHVLTVASREWGYPLPANPVQLIKRPTESASRSRRLEADEEAIILKACSEHPNPWLKPLVILAIETAMRRGEMLGLRWIDVDLQERTALIRESKNVEQRIVPLSRRAVEVLTNLPRSFDVHDPLVKNKACVGMSAHEQRKCRRSQYFIHYLPLFLIWAPKYTSIAAATAPHATLLPS